MRIFIHSPNERKKINLRFPTRLLFNYVTVTLGAKMIDKYVVMDGAISTHDLRRLVKVLRRMKKKHPHLKLVDIESKDGEVVQISF